VSPVAPRNLPSYHSPIGQSDPCGRPDYSGVSDALASRGRGRDGHV